MSWVSLYCILMSCKILLILAERPGDRKLRARVTSTSALHFFLLELSFASRPFRHLRSC